VNKGAEQGARLDVNRMFILEPKEGTEASSVVRALNGSSRGLETLVSYLSESSKIDGEISQVYISAVQKSGVVTILSRVVIGNGDHDSVDLLLEAIAELVDHKLDLAQEKAKESRLPFDAALAEAVNDEIKMGRQIFIKTIKCLNRS
jgi:hypothetical protein